MTATTGTAHALALKLGGYVIDPNDGDGPIILIPAGNRVHTLLCGAFGSVRLATDQRDRRGVEIGTFSQGEDVLAEAYWAAVDGMAA